MGCSERKREKEKERKKEEEREREEKKKSLWGFVLGCSGAEGTAARVSEKPRLSADLSFVVFPSFYTTHFAALAPSSVIHKHL